MGKSRSSRLGTILPSCGVAAPAVIESAVSDAFTCLMEKTHGFLCGFFLQCYRDMLVLCTEISFNAEAHNREGANVMSFQERW